ncbi:MAG: hypothetical protein ACRDNY_00640 [Gaiellaceae bacterium]
MTETRPGDRPPRRRAAAGIGVAAVLSAAVTALLVPLSGSALPQAAPVNTAAPTISGVPAKGETLTASPGTWTGTPPITFTYAWLRCDDNGASCDPVAGASDQTYVLGSGDVGNRIRVRVTASNSDGTAPDVLSDATAEVTEGTPVNQVEPQISGTPTEGQTLTATNGTWAGSQPMTFTHQWVRCGTDGGNADGSNCVVISGATKTTYTLAAADVGARLRVRVTATNSSGATTDASNATQVVASGKSPVNTKRPAVSGSMVEGATVMLDRGTWSGATSFSYQWLRCDSAGGRCVGIAGATGTSYRLTASDVGHKIRVNVTARNSRGPTTVMTGESATVAPAGPAGIIALPNGERSIPATSVPRTERLIVSDVRFTPNPVRSRTAPITVRVRVKDTRGFAVRDALVFVRSTPLVTRGENRQRTGADGWVSYRVLPRFTFPRPRNGYNVQFFVKAYRAGDHPLAGIAGYRLVQVRLAR